MIGELIDRSIAVFSPASAAKRAYARRVYSNLTRSYEAAKSDRTNANWRPMNRSADLEMLSDADTIRARARDLVRNNAYARGIIRALVRNVVGCGIRPEPQIQAGDESPNEQVNKRQLAEWNTWQKRADVTGKLSFYRIQQLAYAEMKEAGEVLIQKVLTPEDRSRRIPFALELIDADRFASDTFFPRSLNPETGNEVRRGVELNSFGQPVAYWLYPRHPNDLNTLVSRAERFPAHDFIHLFKPLRVGQTRGISEFAPIVNWLRNLNYYLDNELQASAVASCFTAVIKTVDAGAGAGLLDDIDDDSNDTDGNQFEYLQPGLVARLLPEEEIETINPARPNSQAEPWINLMLRSMAVGMGLSFERMTRDYSKTNFSSNRASDLEDRREFRSDQELLVDDLCAPVWEQFIIHGALAGIDGFPDPLELMTDWDAATAHRWKPEGWEWVDPKSEALAAKEALASKLTTLADEYGKKGKDWRKQLEQLALEQQTLTELGLKGDVPASEPADQADPNDDEPADETETADDTELATA